MSRMIKTTLPGEYHAMFTLNDAEVAALNVLRNKREGDFKLLITAASVHGDIVQIHHRSPGGESTHRFHRTDVFGPG